jgi:site-specific DNA recombinase
MSTPAAIYARVSSDRQRDQETIASQTTALQTYAATHGYGVPAAWIFEDDGYSGTTLVRPGLEAVRDLAAAGEIAAVLVYAPDRLSRKYAYQILLTEEFARCGVAVIYLNAPPTNTPEEHLLVQVQGMIAEYERAQLLERTRRGKRYKARSGSVNALSGAPYGYRYVKKTDQADAYYQVDEAEAAIVRQLFAAYTQDGRSMSELARWFTARQVPTRHGGRWDPATIRKMLRNPAYIGRAGFGKTAPRARRQIRRRVSRDGRLPVRDQARRERPPDEWVDIPVPALISEETFALAQAQLEQNIHFARRRTKRPTLLQGLLVCAQCGYAVYRRRGVYRCWGRDGWAHANGPVCTAPATREDHLDAVVWREVLRLLEDPTLIEAELGRRREAAQHADPTRQRIDELTREQTRVMTAMDRLLTAYQQGLVMLEELRARMPLLRTQQQTIAAERQALETAAIDRARYLRLTETLTDFRSRLRARATTLDVTERQKVVRLLIKEIRIGPDVMTIRHSLPVGTPEPERRGPAPSPLAAERSDGHSPEWLLHEHRQGARLRSGEGARTDGCGRHERDSIAHHHITSHDDRRRRAARDGGLHECPTRLLTHPRRMKQSRVRRARAQRSALDWCTKPAHECDPESREHPELRRQPRWAALL